jgi:hypothetical protein
MQLRLICGPLVVCSVAVDGRRRHAVALAECRQRAQLAARQHVQLQQEAGRIQGSGLHCDRKLGAAKASQWRDVQTFMCQCWRHLK